MAAAGAADRAHQRPRGAHLSGGGVAAFGAGRATWTRSHGALVGAGLLGACLAAAVPSSADAGRYAIILQAGPASHEGTARALHALLYAKELREHGHEVVLIFDGAGTEWAAELTDPATASKLKPMYEELRRAGVTQVVCDFCAGAFGVKEPLAQRGAPLLGEYAGHPSIAKWVAAGYQLLIL